MKLSFSSLFTRPTIATDSYNQTAGTNRNPLTLFFAKNTPDANVSQETNQTSSQSRFSQRKFKRYLKKSILLPAVLVLIIVGLTAYLAMDNINRRTQATLLDNDGRVDIQKPKASYTVNKTLAFPLRDNKGKEVSKIAYVIENAELRDEIIVKGQRATAVKGRTFLIINLKISNDYNASVQINARDYIRLIVNDSKEKLAPDIHNDPVEIQAISTKPTRLGFPINDTDKNLKLQIGEINGKKETVQIIFK